MTGMCVCTDRKIGTAAAACALAYIDFRMPELEWRSNRPALAAWFETFGARPSMAATVPEG